MGRHALEHGSSSLLIADARWDRNELIRGDCGEFRIAAERTTPRHAVAFLYRGNVGANLHDRTCAFLPWSERQRNLVAPFTLVDVNEINTGSGQFDDRFIRLRLWNRQIHQFHGFRPTWFLDLYRFHESLDSRPAPRDSACAGYNYKKHGLYARPKCRTSSATLSPRRHSWLKSNRRLLPITLASILCFIFSWLRYSCSA